MKKMTFDSQRRRALLTAVTAVAAAPFLKSSIGHAAEGTLPHLSESDTTAKSLHYHNDAQKAPRVDKSGVPASDQFCHNCMFIQAASGEWRPCQIFPGKAVNANGWCMSWTKQA